LSDGTPDDVALDDERPKALGEDLLLDLGTRRDSKKGERACAIVILFADSRERNSRTNDAASDVLKHLSPLRRFLIYFISSISFSEFLLLERRQL